MDTEKIINFLKEKYFEEKGGYDEEKNLLLTEILTKIEELKELPTASGISFVKEFNKLLTEVFSFENDFESSKKNFLQALLNQGIKANPDAVFSLFEMTNTRLVRMFVTKSICNLLGLQHEMDRIMDKEMDLIYSARERITSGVSQVIVGERNDGARK
jgi:hypothetical protein